MSRRIAMPSALALAAMALLLLACADAAACRPPSAAARAESERRDMRQQRRHVRDTSLRADAIALVRVIALAPDDSPDGSNGEVIAQVEVVRTLKGTPPPRRSLALSPQITVSCGGASGFFETRVEAGRFHVLYLDADGGVLRFADDRRGAGMLPMWRELRDIRQALRH